MANTYEHDQGGRRDPYELYHLDDDAYKKATQVATQEDPGLMSAEAFQNADRVTPPASSGSGGYTGQYARDDDYDYFCYDNDNWLRISMETFNYYSSSSSVSSSRILRILTFKNN